MFALHLSILFTFLMHIWIAFIHVLYHHSHNHINKTNRNSKRRLYRCNSWKIINECEQNDDVECAPLVSLRARGNCIMDSKNRIFERTRSLGVLSNVDHLSLIHMNISSKWACISVRRINKISLRLSSINHSDSLQDTRIHFLLHNMVSSIYLS